MTETLYARFATYVERVAMTFARRTGTEYDDWLQEARLACCRAVASWDPAKGPLEARVHVQVYRGLLEETRKRKRLARPDLRPRPAPRPEEPLILSDDARAVFRLLAHTAPDRPKPTFLRGLTRLLLDLGWAGARVAEAFAELKEVIS